MKIHSLTFDLDGTLLDTVPDLSLACNNMLGDLGEAPYPPETISTFVGKGVAHLVSCCLSRQGPPDAERLEQGMQSFQRHYLESNGRAAQIYPGVREGLLACQKLGLPMGVLTNKPAQFTLPLLQRMGLAEFFSVVVSGDTTKEKKPHPEPVHYACRALGSSAAQHLHIGDSHHDIAAARAAGCAIWCVPYGYHGNHPISANDCDLLVADLAVAAERLAADLAGAAKAL